MAAWRCAWGRDFCSGWEVRAEPHFFLQSEEAVGEARSVFGMGMGSTITCLRAAETEQKDQFIAIYEFLRSVF